MRVVRVASSNYSCKVVRPERSVLRRTMFLHLFVIIADELGYPPQDNRHRVITVLDGF